MELRPFDVVAEELLSGEWKREQRAGVEHFVPGQARASAAADEDGGPVWLLAYAPAEGHSILAVPFERVARRAWEHVGFAIRLRSSGVSMERVSADFVLSSAMEAALDRALAEALAEPEGEADGD